MTGPEPTRKEKLPRDAAGSFDLQGGTGGIIAMCSLGGFLEIYKLDATFRVKTPDCIDPARTNPTAPFVVAVADSVGSASPVVARVLLQGRDIVDSIGCGSDEKKDSVIQALHACKEALVVCERVAERVTSRIDEIVNRIEAGSVKHDRRSGTINPLPQVPDLDADATGFLIHAKRAIQEICRLPRIILGLPTKDTNFDYLAKTLTKSIGPDADLTDFVIRNARAVEYLIDLRNHQEHPEPKATVIENFSVTATTSISPPAWYVVGDKPAPIREQMASAVPFLISIAECTLIEALLEGSDKRVPYVVEEIDPADVDPRMPIRYRATLDLSKFRVESGPRCEPDRAAAQDGPAHASDASASQPPPA